MGNLGFIGPAVTGILYRVEINHAIMHKMFLRTRNISADLMIEFFLEKIILVKVQQDSIIQNSLDYTVFYFFSFSNCLVHKHEKSTRSVEWA